MTFALPLDLRRGHAGDAVAGTLALPTLPAPPSLHRRSRHLLLRSVTRLTLGRDVLCHVAVLCQNGDAAERHYPRVVCSELANIVSKMITIKCSHPYLPAIRDRCCDLLGGEAESHSMTRARSRSPLVGRYLMAAPYRSHRMTMVK